MWQLLAQSFFFSTYASLLNADKQAKSVWFHQEQDVLFWLVPIAAFLAGLLTAVSIFTSLANIADLRHLFEDYTKDEAAEDQSAKLFLPIQGVERFGKLATIAPIGLPILFIAAWLMILIRPLLPIP